MNSMKETKKLSERLKRVGMQEQPADKRRKNFEEVPYGYTESEATAEARRCLQCGKPLCVKGCPVAVQIPEFINLIAAGEFAAAARKIKETNSLPAICGRVCPQEEQCEVKCILGKKGDSIGIGNLERFAADWEREHNVIELPPVKPPNGRKVAVIGSGPAGLTVAGELIKEGFEVVVFEALHEPGGVLVYGIPEFRLPKEIVKKEIEYLQQMGVKIEKNFVVGKTITIDELFEEEGFDAVFVGSGAGLPAFMGIPGENSIGVYSANEYLTRSNLMKAYEPGSNTPILRGRRVATVGGGNVAMDSARTALRLGAERSIIVYRRSETEMPARLAEIHHAKEEGIEFHLLCNPVEILRPTRSTLSEPCAASAWSSEKPILPGGAARCRSPAANSKSIAMWWSLRSEINPIRLSLRPPNSSRFPSGERSSRTSRMDELPCSGSTPGETSSPGLRPSFSRWAPGGTRPKPSPRTCWNPRTRARRRRKTSHRKRKPSKPGVHANRVVEDRTANEASFAQCADSPRERRLAPNLDCLRRQSAHCAKDASFAVLFSSPTRLVVPCPLSAHFELHGIQLLLCRVLQNQTVLSGLGHPFDDFSLVGQSRCRLEPS